MFSSESLIFPFMHNTKRGTLSAFQSQNEARWSLKNNNLAAYFQIKYMRRCVTVTHICL